jgi:type I restriction enzyme R subunit
VALILSLVFTIVLTLKTPVLVWIVRAYITLFTGTPLLADDHITERTFGGYLSVYDFKRAVEDGATVPLYYENRADKIAQLDKPEITGRILDAIEAADLDPSQEEKLEREFAKEIHILTADERLRSIAKDFVEHYSDLWTSGKAMFVCLNKVTCVRMYNYVQECWRAKIRELEVRQGTATQQEAQELARKLAWMKETEMAVVISQEQNEVQTFKKWGLDILPHRAKMEKRELDKEFKDSKNPFRVVFVCAMWLTGFDVKCLSCLYLAKRLGISPKAVEKHLANLKASDLLHRIGPDKGGHWKVNA